MAGITPPLHPPRRGHYGFDAPYTVFAYLAGGVACLVIASLWATGPVPVVYGPLWVGIYGIVLLAMGASRIYTARRGKFRVWAELVAALNLHGDEQILDLGCGRGLVLLEVARHLTTGTATGVDLRHGTSRSGKSREATLANAQAERVADRVELHAGDMSTLPFADASFDVVVSSHALHNLRRDSDREQALDEAIRVLKPNGRLLITDFRLTESYVERLRVLRLADVSRRNLGWRYWYGGPPWATHLVSARKPSDWQRPGPAPRSPPPEWPGVFGE